jgi:hypothetical protein
MITATPRTNFREERDFGQVINATFAFLRQHVKPLGKALLFIVGPFALASAIFMGLHQSRVASLASGTAEGIRTIVDYSIFQQVSSLHYLAGTFFMLMSTSLLYLTVYAYLVEHMDSDEGTVEVSQVWDRVKQYFLPGFYSLFGVVFLVMLGLVVLILPGIYLAVVLSLFYMVMVREDSDFLETVERCFALIKGYWWPTFGLLLVVVLIQGMIGLVFTLPTVLIGVLQAFAVPGGDSRWLLVTATSLSSIAGVFLYTLSALAIAFQYFNLVEIKEGVGLLEQVDRIGVN